MKKFKQLSKQGKAQVAAGCIMFYVGMAAILYSIALPALFVFVSATLLMAGIYFVFYFIKAWNMPSPTDMQQCSFMAAILLILMGSVGFFNTSGSVMIFLCSIGVGCIIGVGIVCLVVFVGAMWAWDKA